MNIAEIRAQYPQYNDLSDDQLASALHAKFYSDMPRDEFNAKIGLGKQPEAKPERSLTDSLGRAAGLTARYAVEGMAALPGMVINPLTVAAGQKPWTQALSDTLTSFGLPQPESPKPDPPPGCHHLPPAGLPRPRRRWRSRPPPESCCCATVTCSAARFPCSETGTA